MIRIYLITTLTILALSLSACVSIEGDDNDYTDSLNTTTSTDSFNTYTDAQNGILEDGYTPDEAGICGEDYFWCSIEEKCLPAVEGATCPLSHSDEDEAAADEATDNEG